MFSQRLYRKSYISKYIRSKDFVILAEMFSNDVLQLERINVLCSEHAFITTEYERMSLCPKSVF